MTRSEAERRAERETMVAQQIEARGVRDERTLEALRSVPRHRFVGAREASVAYQDAALPLTSGQTISQPYIVAVMTEALQLQGGERVLEIGTGSGYQAAVLAEAVGPDGEVYTVERHASLSERAREVLDEIGLADRIHFRVGDGTVGWQEYAPYDAIIVTAGGPTVPDSLFEQLKDGGRLVIPFGTQTGQDLVRIVRLGDQREQESLGAVRFVPLVGEEGWDER